jgi:hypothetical protein
MPLAAAGAGTKFLLMFGWIWAFVGLVLAVAFTFVGGPVWNDWILDSRGQETMAQTIGARGTASTRGNWERVYVIEMTFEDSDGRTHRVEAATTEPQLIEKAQAQQPVPIEYDPQAPATRVRLVGETSATFGSVILVPIGFLVVGLALALVGHRNLKRDRALYRDGDVAEATVVAVTPTSMRINKQRVFRVDYTFAHPTGAARGVWKTTTPPRLDDRLWVIYDPSQPTRNIAASS